jgi:glycosidase
MPSDVKPVIYQLVVRYFGNTNTTNQRDGTLAVNGCGRFDDVSAAALDAIRKMGATHVWLTGCLRQATLTDYSSIGLPADDPDVVKGIAGSFYAVRDYFDVSPDYARDPVNRLAEFDALVRRIHDAGMKAVIDLVPNHVARGNESVVNPDVRFGDGDDTSQFFHPANHLFYVVDPPGQKLRLARPEHWNPPGFTFDGAYGREDGAPGRPPKVTGNNSVTASPSVYDWYETVKLNYGYNFVTRTGHYTPRPRTWDVMNQVLAFWQARGVDGFRCDFAHYIPAEAWTFLIGRARRRDPGAYFFAEAYPYHGSGDPVTDMRQLVECGFDAVYHDDSYNRLKRIYQGSGTQQEYDWAMSFLSAETRRHIVLYLENHDERRIPSPVVPDVWSGESGFGTADAGYLLAPLQYLYGPGPVLMLNGQEVGEPGEGFEGYGGEDGRTTLFDYWCMPAFAKWVNDHTYDGGGLSEEQRALRHFYSSLLALCQDASVRGDSYWGLKYVNRPERFPDCPADLYTFARFQGQGRRLLVVAANFNLSASITARVRIPGELGDASDLPANLTVRLRLDRGGAKDVHVVKAARQSLASDGFEVTLPAQTSQVYVIE